MVTIIAITEWLARETMVTLRLALLAMFVGCAASAAEPGTADTTGRLRALLDGTDRLVVRTGGLCHRDSNAEVILTEVDGTKAVAEVIQQLRVSEIKLETADEPDRDEPELAWGVFMECGDYTLEFYRAGNLQESVTLLGLGYLRCPDPRGRGDLPLAASSREFLMSRFGLIDVPEWKFDESTGKPVLVRPVPREKTEANK